MFNIKKFNKPYVIRDNNMVYGIVEKNIFSCKAIYVDIPIDNHYLSDAEFNKQQLHVKFIGQMGKEGEQFELTQCKCKKGDFQKLIKVITNIHNSALIKGYGEIYEQGCKYINTILKEN